MVTQYIGARYVPLFYTASDNSNDWESGVQYDPLTIVTYLNQSYTSKIPVPASVGNPADNPTYWIMTGAYNAQVEEYRQEVEDLQTNVTNAINDLVSDVGTEFKRVNDKNYKYSGLKIVGHAGAGTYAPANTMFGFNLAAALGADAIECDVQITSDHVPVCAHDPTVDGYVLKETPFVTVDAIEVDSGGYHWGAQTIPQLSSFLRVCKGSNKTAVIEFKWEAANHMEVSDLPYVKAVVDESLIDDVVFISWIPDPLEAYLELDPNAKCIWLLSSPTPVSNANIDLAKEKGFYGVGLPYNTTVDYMAYAHSIGMRVMTFTVPSWSSAVVNSLNMRVDYITTDSLLTCGDWVHTKWEEGYVATAPSVQGVPMLSKYFCTVNDPTYPFFVNTVTSSDTTKSGPARYYAAISNNRAYSMPLAVSAGDIIKSAPTSAYDIAVDIFNSGLNTRIATSGWLTGNYTVPASGEIAIITYRKKDNGAIEFWDIDQMHQVFKGIKRA